MSEASIIFSTTGGIFGRLVRWFTRSRVSHVGIATTFHGVLVVIHADFGGVQVMLWSKFIRENEPVVSFIPMDIDVDGAILSAVSEVGEAYDYVGILGYAVVMIARRWGRRIANPLAGAKAAVCSELVARALCAVLPEWRSFIDPEQVTPEDLLCLVEQSKHFTRI